MKKLKYTRMILDLFMPGPRKTKDDPVVVNDGGVRRPYEINTDGAVMGALLGRVNGGESTEEDLSAPAYDYTPGSFGYGPFTYGDFSYKDQALLDAAKQKVNNFSYNPDEDTSYKAYARQYTRNGEDALRNTMARLASRTGGVASSYAVQAAQGAYNNYMQELANKVPELSELAYQKLQNEYNLYNTEYNRDLAKWKADRDFAYDQYEDAKDIAYKNFQLQEAARQKAYDQQYNLRKSAYEKSLSGGETDDAAAKYKADLEAAVDAGTLSGEEAWNRWQAYLDPSYLTDEQKETKAREKTEQEVLRLLRQSDKSGAKKEADKELKAGNISRATYDELIQRIDEWGRFSINEDREFNGRGRNLR